MFKVDDKFEYIFPTLNLLQSFQHTTHTLQDDQPDGPPRDDAAYLPKVRKEYGRRCLYI